MDRERAASGEDRRPSRCLGSGPRTRHRLARGAWFVALLALTAARTDGGSLQRALYPVLRGQLSASGSVYSDSVFHELSARTGLGADPLRRGLLGQLARLDSARREEEPPWPELIELRGADVSPGAADRFLSQVLVEARGMLEGDGNYLLDSALRQAARKARLQPFQGRDLLLRALDWAETGSVMGGPDGGIGILVDGHTNRYEVHRDPLMLFFASDDEAFVVEQVREIQRFIVPAVVRRLPESGAVRWAVRQREYNPLIEPGCRLVIGVDNLSFTGTNADLRPCVEARVDLLGWPEGEALQRWDLSYCTETHGSATTHNLDPFYDEVAEQIRDLVGGFLSR